MSMSVAEIHEQIRNLSVDERAELAQKILTDLDDLSPEENERIWLDESERRLEAMKSGELPLVDAQTVFAKADALLNER